eukprot:1155373-Pelagomonas_calceolata.AAC.1
MAFHPEVLVFGKGDIGTKDRESPSPEGSAVWVWWVSGSMRPQGTRVMFIGRKGKGYIAEPAYEGSLAEA